MNILRDEQRERLLEQLDDYDAAGRRRALVALAQREKAAWLEPRERINMHIHSFFSYNANQYSPSRVAWESRARGLYAAGLCDFDVLDGLEEFLEAGRLLGLRATVNLETRAFWGERSSVDINSPGEPGVTYIMGAGFARLPDPGTPQADALDRLRQGAGLRNRALIERINRRLPDIALDYDREVLPLSPSGTPTERHIVRAYRRKAESAFADQGSRLRFWSEILKADPGAVSEWEPDIPVMEEKIRGALVKRGGIGYERPTAGTFPPIEDFILWVRDCRALPTVAWLDGTAAGEADALTMLERLHALGACALNIIPDRNYRIANPDQRSVKVRKLAEIVAAAETLGFPINIGTEMNKDGQPFVDDTGAEALQPYHAAFMKGARIMVGHTILGRYADYAYVGEAAQIEFGTNAERKNAFFEAAGSLPPLTDTLARRLESLGPQKSLACLHDSASHGSWRL